MSAPPATPTVYLDACCLINLLATGRAAEILAASPGRFAVSGYVAMEEVRLPRNRGAEATKFLQVTHLKTARELDTFVRFASRLDDGEASTCALAVIRGGAVATDDRKALGVLAEWAPEVPTLQTAELVYPWAATVSGQEVGLALERIAADASFFPRRGTPHFEWWVSYFR